MVMTVHTDQTKLAHTALHQIDDRITKAFPHLHAQIVADGKQLSDGMIHVAIVHMRYRERALILHGKAGAQLL